MNYELAKELKDAGFPSGGSGDWFCSHGHHTDSVTSTLCTDEYFYAPTLSELISACGSGYKLFCLSIGFSVAQEACAPMPVYSTPEEAVARLYIDIAKNKKP